MAESRWTRSTKDDPTGDVPAPTVHAVLRAVRDAEVLYIAFPRLQRALVIDPRPIEPRHPAALVAALPFGAGGEATAIERLRPGRSASAHSIAATWGGSTRAFAEQGVLSAIIARLPAREEAGVRSAFEELRAAERGSVQAGLPASEGDDDGAAPRPGLATAAGTGDAGGGRMTSRYDPLGEHLAAVGAPEIKMTFAEVEAIIGPLPMSARNTPAWWGATPGGQRYHAHVRHWWRLGYIADRPDFAAGTVTFRRIAR